MPNYLTDIITAVLTLSKMYRDRIVKIAEENESKDKSHESSILHNACFSFQCLKVFPKARIGNSCTVGLGNLG